MNNLLKNSFFLAVLLIVGGVTINVLLLSIFRLNQNWAGDIVAAILVGYIYAYFLREEVPSSLRKYAVLWFVLVEFLFTVMITGIVSGSISVFLIMGLFSFVKFAIDGFVVYWAMGQFSKMLADYYNKQQGGSF
jgi:hypothetical protein